MQVIVVHDHRYDRTPDGAIWSWAYGPEVWKRYLAVFDRITIVARVRDVDRVEATWKRNDSDVVRFHPIPYYLGPTQLLRQFRAVQRAVNAAYDPEAAYLLRVSGTLPTMLEKVLRRHRHPYGVEVISDPYDQFAPGSMRHPLRPFVRWQYTANLRRQCARAVAALYVTRFALQQRYPCPHVSVGVSDVELCDDAYADAPRVFTAARPLTLVMVGALGQLYKAPDVLVDAFAQCVAQGDDLRMVLIGDGQYRAVLQARAAALQVQDRIAFPGFLPAGEPVRAQLDAADLFVLPSRQEGLPRALVEAMARGLPCLGSTVGGIPELLDAEDLVPPGDVAALATKIHDVVRDPARLTRMSQRNLAKSREYADAILSQRRTAFFTRLAAQTQRHLPARAK